MIFKNINKIKTFLLIIIILPYLNSCGIYRKVDAKEYPPEPEKRIKKNMEEGRGLRLFGNKKKGGVFDFASSNSLWRASLDTIDFMPLISANYSGGIIITDWYNDSASAGQSVKISIRFLTNEVCNWVTITLRNLPPLSKMTTSVSKIATFTRLGKRSPTLMASRLRIV